jgi:hypothetical protein
MSIEQEKEDRGALITCTKNVGLVYRLDYDDSSYHLNDKLFKALMKSLAGIERADFKELECYEIDGSAYLLFKFHSNMYLRASNADEKENCISGIRRLVELAIQSALNLVEIVSIYQ